MRTNHTFRVLPILLFAASGCLLATFDSGGAATERSDLAVACADAPDAVAPPGGVPGDVLRCAKLQDLDAYALEARSRAVLGDASHRAYVSGARVYRVLYRTTRATVPT